MKFAQIDRAYLDRRKSLSAKYGERELWSIIDHWPLYCGIANLGRSLAISDLLRSTLTVPGHVAEFGSWRGANLVFLAKLLRIFDPHGSKLVHCFESFEGLSTFVPEDGASVETRGKYKGSYEELTDIIALYEMQDEIVIHKGLVQDTLPASLEQQKELSFSFAYCDVDLYEPTRLILDQIHARLSCGGMFVLDEWNAENFPGETLAVREFLVEHGSQYAVEHVRNARQPTLVLRKIAT
jgi:macrocin-O-methyltransferase TylF-like protien